MMRKRPDLDDLDGEIREHIEAETLDNIAAGMPADKARAAALRKFGNIARVKEDVREVWVARWWDQLEQDARDAFRRIRRYPGFALAVAVTLALGIGLTTAIYSVVNAVLLRPLSYPHPDRVVWLTARELQSNTEMMNGLDFAEWRAQASSFEHMVAYAFQDATVVSDHGASRWRLVLASEGFWQLSGASAVLGSLPAATDQHAMVLTHRTFQDRFHGDPGVIGRAVSIDGEPVTIAAILPAEFNPQLPAWAARRAVDHVPVEAYRTLIPPPAGAPRHFDQPVPIYLAVGSVRPDVTVDAARVELETIHARLQQGTSGPFGLTTPVVIPLQEKLVGASRLPLRILLAAAFCVLLITCANVANLLMSRSSARQKEIALRLSVGGGPLRLIRQLLAESIAYAAIGGAVGVLLAWWLVTVVASLMGPAIPRLQEASVDLRVLVFAVLTSIATAVLFGIGPALALSRTRAQEVLKEGARTVSSSRRLLLAGRAAISLQLALAIVLLVGAGLMLKSVWQMTRYPDGFDPATILTLRVDFSGPAYGDAHAERAYADALLARARTLPGVTDVALTTSGDSITLVIKEGEAMPEHPELHAASVSAISAGFGPLIGMSLASGRWLTDHEATPVVLINESLARREYPGMDPIGRRIRIDWLGTDALATIVGVVRDLKYTRLDADAVPEIFVPHSTTNLFGVTLLMRIAGEPLAAAAAITQDLAAIDPTQSFFEVKTMEQALAESIAPRRFNLMLLGTFALVALTLAVLGVYGVIAYAVASRTHEIGIRLALGAERGRVMTMILRQGMTSVVIGVAVGLGIATWATQVIATLLYEVQTNDGPTFVAAASLLTATAFAACAAPALRCALIDPARALRAE